MNVMDTMVNDYWHLLLNLVIIYREWNDWLRKQLLSVNFQLIIDFLYVSITLLFISQSFPSLVLVYVDFQVSNQNPSLRNCVIFLIVCQKSINFDLQIYVFISQLTFPYICLIVNFFCYIFFSILFYYLNLS